MKFYISILAREEKIENKSKKFIIISWYDQHSEMILNEEWYEIIDFWRRLLMDVFSSSLKLAVTQHLTREKYLVYMWERVITSNFQSNSKGL